MVVKGITDEDFVNYKKASLFVSAPSCTFKCDKESGERCCQNSALASAEDHEISNDELAVRYLCNPITSAVVFGGLEPLDRFDEILSFIRVLRRHYQCPDDVVIYTGYDKEEITSQLKQMAEYPNIIVKFGRFIPGLQPHHDELLGVNLASPNQYAERIS